MRFGVERGPSHALEILRSQAEVGQDFMVRNDLSAPVGGPPAMSRASSSLTGSSSIGALAKATGNPVTAIR